MRKNKLVVICPLNDKGEADSVKILQHLGFEDGDGTISETIVNGRSFGDVLKALSTFFGIELTVAPLVLPGMDGNDRVLIGPKRSGGPKQSGGPKRSRGSRRSIAPCTKVAGTGNTLQHT
jgi:hypothetical protein